jgi:hypothetical protein
LINFSYFDRIIDNCNVQNSITFNNYYTLGKYAGYMGASQSLVDLKGGEVNHSLTSKEGRGGEGNFHLTSKEEKRGQFPLDLQGGDGRAASIDLRDARVDLRRGGQAV